MEDQPHRDAPRLVGLWVIEAGVRCSTPFLTLVRTLPPVPWGEVWEARLYIDGALTVTEAASGRSLSPHSGASIDVLRDLVGAKIVNADVIGSGGLLLTFDNDHVVNVEEPKDAASTWIFTVTINEVGDGA